MTSQTETFICEFDTLKMSFFKEVCAKIVDVSFTAAYSASFLAKSSINSLPKIEGSGGKSILIGSTLAAGVVGGYYFWKKVIAPHQHLLPVDIHVPDNFTPEGAEWWQILDNEERRNHRQQLAKCRTYDVESDLSSDEEDDDATSVAAAEGDIESGCD